MLIEHPRGHRCHGTWKPESGQAPGVMSAWRYGSRRTGSGDSGRGQTERLEEAPGSIPRLLPQRPGRWERTSNHALTFDSETFFRRGCWIRREKSDKCVLKIISRTFLPIMAKVVILDYSSPPFPVVSLSMISAVHFQPCSRNSKLKTP